MEFYNNDTFKAFPKLGREIDRTDIQVGMIWREGNSVYEAVAVGPSAFTAKKVGRALAEKPVSIKYDSVVKYSPKSYLAIIDGKKFYVPLSVLKNVKKTVLHVDKWWAEKAGLL